MLLYRCLTSKNKAEVGRNLEFLRWVIRERPETLDLLGVSQARERGRPKGSVDKSLREAGVALAMAVDWCRLKPADVLRS
jgi:hypothetical protein